MLLDTGHPRLDCLCHWTHCWGRSPARGREPCMRLPLEGHRAKRAWLNVSTTECTVSARMALRTQPLSGPALPCATPQRAFRSSPAARRKVRSQLRRKDHQVGADCCRQHRPPVSLSLGDGVLLRQAREPGGLLRQAREPGGTPAAFSPPAPPVPCNAVRAHAGRQRRHSHARTATVRGLARASALALAPFSR